MGLQAGSLMTDAEFLIGIDGDALLDPHAAKWMMRHFLEDSTVAAVTVIHVFVHVQLYWDVYRSVNFLQLLA